MLGRDRAWLALLVVVAVGCGSQPPAPTVSPTAGPTNGPTSSLAPSAAPSPGPATPPPKVVGDLELEACDPAGTLACEHQQVALAEAVTGTGVSLTYSSEWADGRLDRPAWSAAPLGLGGWALDVVERYDAANGVFLDGDGRWRVVAPVALESGEQAIPAYDGREYYVFDAAWRHVRTIDGITGATTLTLTYDADGRLTSVEGQRDNLPVHVTVQRDADGVPSAILGIEGVATRLAMDPDGYLAYVARPNGTAFRPDPGAWGLLDGWSQDGRGHWRFTWDEAGRLVESTDPDGVVRRLTRSDAAGSVSIEVAPASGAPTTYSATRDGDAIHRVVAMPGGRTLDQVTMADGSTTTTWPDLTVVTTGAEPHPLWGASAPIRSPYVETRPDGVVHRIEIGQTVQAGKGAGGEVPWETEFTVNGERITESYDPATRTLRRIDLTARETVVVFDEVGRVAERRVPGQPSVAFTYDGLGRLASETTGADDVLAVTTYAYDGSTGEVVITRPDGTIDREAYDAAGLMVRSSLADGTTVSYVRDPAGELLQARYGQNLSTTLGYSGAGRLTAYLPPTVGDDDTYETRTYDANGNIATLTGPGERSVNFNYDDAGRVASWEFDRGTSSAAYEPGTGHLVRLEAPGGVVTELGFTGDPPTSLTWSGPVSGRVDLRRDGSRRPVAETVNGAAELNFSYDAGGSLLSLGPVALQPDGVNGLPGTATLGVVETLDRYDLNGRLARTTTTISGSIVLDIAYTRDVFGRIINVTQGPVELGEPLPREIDYTYDDAGRLSGATVNGLASTFAYDAAGNLITVTTGSEEAVAATYDDRNRLVTRGIAAYTSDPDGTLASRTDPAGTTSYDFDDFGVIRAVTLADGRQVEYVVDAAGRRVGRTVDGTLTDGFLYRPGGAIVAQTNGAGEIVARFGYDDLGRLALVQRDGRNLLVTTDQLGSPILLVDGESGEVVQEIEYDTWGRVLSDSNPGLQPFGFAGGLADPDTGLVRFGAREYDPTTGRWTGPDPVLYAGGDPNLYRYASGDPVNRTDPNGLGCMGCGGGGGTYPVYIPPSGGNNGGATPTGPSGGTAPDAGGGSRDAGGPSNPQGGGGSGDSGAGGGSSGGSAGGPGGNSDNGSAGGPGSGNQGNPAGGSTGGGGGGGGGGRGGGGLCVGLCFPPGGGFCLGICSFGEPHLRTADGVFVDFQGAGEFTMSRSADSSFVLQARQEPPGARTDVTLTSALAAVVGGDRVSFYSEPDRQMVVNGEVIDRVDYSARLAGGGVLERHGTEASLEWPDGSRLLVHLYGYFLNYDFDPADALAPTLTGVLGSADGVAANDLTTSTGTVLDPDASDFWDRLHHEFADSWRISDAESLFDYRPGESTATFTRPEIPTQPATLDLLDAETRAAAEALCRALGISAEPILSSCILDVGLTGDSSFAAGAAAVAAATSSVPVTPEGPALPVELGQPVSGALVAGSVDRYSFSAQAGDVVYIEATSDDCVEGLSWRLLKPDGTLSWFDQTCIDLGRRVLDVAGDWIIEVYSNTNATGPYAFVIQGVPAARETAISLGQEVSDTIAAVGEWHRYRLSASAGDVVYIDATSDVCVEGLSWRLLKPDGTLSWFDRTCIDLGRRVLDVAGEWVIEVYSSTTVTGPYAFVIQGVPAARETAISLGQQVSDTIDQVGEWHRYRLTATAGQVVNLDALGECVEGVSWRLLQPDGGLRWFERTCVDIGRRELDVAGDWVIEVYSDGVETGAYSFRVDSAT